MARRRPNPRERIVDAALALFARFGVDGARLADLARSAGMAKTTLYHHFPEGKDAIFRVAVDYLVGEHFRRFETAVRAEPCPVTRLARYVRLRTETFDDEILRWGIKQPVWDGMKPLVYEALAPYFARELALLTEIVREGMERGLMRPGRAETVARLLQASFRGLTLDGPISPSPIERSAELAELSEFVGSGLLTVAARECWQAALRRS